MVGLGRRGGGGGEDVVGKLTLCKIKWRGEMGLTRSLEGAGMHAEVTCNAQRQPGVNTRPIHTKHTQKRSTPFVLLRWTDGRWVRHNNGHKKNP